MEKDAHARSDYVPKVRTRMARPRPSRSSPPPAPRSRLGAGARTTRRPPAGTARGFRPEALRLPFGSGPSPALTRELSRSLNIRDQRLAPARISGEGHEEKDPVTPLPVPLVTQASALGAAAPSGATSPAARGGGARLFLGTFQRNRGPGVSFSRPPPPEGRHPSLRPAGFPRRRYFA